MLAKPVPPRLHVILARESSLGVLIRRGPSRKVAVIGWDRDGDQFHMGQWLRGRIYERRCDLSPDGRHLIYFAMNGWPNSKVAGQWTAVSKAPYLKALGLWSMDECYCGGGLFITNELFWLNEGCFAWKPPHRTVYEAPGLKHQSTFPGIEYMSSECPGVYYVRLVRDGWTLHEKRPDGAGGHITYFSKRIDDSWSLHKYACETIYHPVGRGCYFDQHSLHNDDTGQIEERPDWEWAEVDGSRLVWASEGKIFSGHLEREGLTNIKQLFDSTKVHYERIRALY